MALVSLNSLSSLTSPFVKLQLSYLYCLPYFYLRSQIVSSNVLFFLLRTKVGFLALKVLNKSIFYFSIFRINPIKAFAEYYVRKGKYCTSSKKVLQKFFAF